MASACRQIYLECVSIYYKENIFHIMTSGNLHYFLAAIGPTNKDLIATISLSYADRHKVRTFRGLAGLKEIRQGNWNWERVPAEYTIPAVSLQDFVFASREMERTSCLTLCCRGRTVADRDKCEAKNGSFDCWVNDAPADKQSARRG